MALVNITFQADTKLRDRLEELAKDNYRSMSAQIKQILEDYLEK